MKQRSLSYLLLFVAFFATGFAYADPPGRAGRVSYVSGSVLFYDEYGGWREAGVNYPVTSQNSLATRANSRAEVRVGSSALRIDGNSQLDLLGVTDNVIDARLAQGALNVRVRNLYQGDVVRIVTPHSTTTIRAAGRYRIDTDAQATRLSVLQGSASMVDTANRESLLYAGSSGVADANNRYSGATEMAMSDEFDDWSRERDHRIERSRSAGYVSPEMTGYESLDEYGAWQSNASYGNVWVPTYVASNWAPYRDGRWVFVQPWGWTWVDNAPWGFAPSHYGRWVSVNGFWAWAPGRYHARPVYAPAMVAFVGDPGWNVSFAFGNAPAVGWIPLGWNEPYYPHYHCSNQYIRDVNHSHVTNNLRAGYQPDQQFSHRPFTTVIPRDQFSKPVSIAQQLVKSFSDAPVTRTAPVAPPVLPRAVMGTAPGLDTPQPGLMHRRFGREPGLMQNAPQAQANNDVRSMPPAQVAPGVDARNGGLPPGMNNPRMRHDPVSREPMLVQQAPVTRAPMPRPPIENAQRPAPDQPQANGQPAEQAPREHRRPGWDRMLMQPAPQPVTVAQPIAQQIARPLPPAVMQAPVMQAPVIHPAPPAGFAQQAVQVLQRPAPQTAPAAQIAQQAAPPAQDGHAQHRQREFNGRDDERRATPQR